MSSVVSIAELLMSLEEGGALLLPHSSAARELRSAYDARQRNKGLGVWEPANVLAWTQWTNRLYSDLIVSGSENRLLLNVAQEQSLWQEIIKNDPTTGALESAESLSELAGSAFKLAAAWNATERLRASATNEDTRTFARWSEEFTKRCAKQGCLSASLLDAALTQHVTAGVLKDPGELKLVGFTNLTPSQERLLEALRARGTIVEQLALVAEGSNSIHAGGLAETPRAEIEVAARWLRTTLETAPADAMPRIAVIVPDAASERSEIERIFREVLAPELQSVRADLSSTPWEFSSGVPLSSLAMIADAMDIARWANGPLPQQGVTALLLSPYLGGDRELAAQIDARVRRKEKLLRPELGLEAFVALLDKHSAEMAWPRNLATELGRGGDLTKPRSYADWMEFFRKLMQAAGWPGQGSRPLSAMEFELTRAWDGVLDLVSTLDFAGQRVSMATAFEALEMQVKATQFVPLSNNAPVQVMTPGEAEGCVVDAVLFLHATDENWPPRERTHPLLSWQLQRSLGMPGTDAAQTAGRTRALTKELLNRSKTALFFYAKDDESGHVRPSPLLHELGLAVVKAESLASSSQTQEWIAYDVISDDSHLPSLPSPKVQGGARVLQLQAACGFRAFAELRLKASEPDSADIGLDAMESGNIVHGVLQRFWKATKSNEELAAMSLQRRDDLLRQCINDTVAKEKLRAETLWDDAYLSVVQQRLFQVLQPWLDLELARGPFTVLDTECEVDVAVGPLQLTVRMDRIDRAQDGNVLVDYKTGASAKPAQWGVPRPEEPQLPLYTMAFEPDEVKAIAFAKILAGEKLAWLGMQGEAGILPMKKTEDILVRIDEWRVELTRLAEEFAAGRATVSPKQYPQTCVYCPQRLLCRIDPVTFARLTNEDDQEDTDG